MTSQRKVNLNATIPAELLERLDQEAWFRHINRSKLVRLLLTEALNKIPAGRRREYGMLLTSEEAAELTAQGYSLESKEWVQPELPGIDD